LSQTFIVGAGVPNSIQQWPIYNSAHSVHYLACWNVIGTDFQIKGTTRLYKLDWMNGLPPYYLVGIPGVQTSNALWGSTYARPCPL
jgi:hypothetical protein